MTKSKRDQIAELANQLRDDDRIAAASLLDSLDGGKGKAFLDQVEELRNDSVPGEPLDSILGNILTILQNARSIAAVRQRPDPTVDNPLGELRP